MKEYRVKLNNPNGSSTCTGTTDNSKEVGRVYRRNRDLLKSGESVELQEREIPSWVTVEQSKKD